MLTLLCSGVGTRTLSSLLGVRKPQSATRRRECRRTPPPRSPQHHEPIRRWTHRTRSHMGQHPTPPRWRWLLGQNARSAHQAQPWPLRGAMPAHFNRAVRQSSAQYVRNITGPRGTTHMGYSCCDGVFGRHADGESDFACQHGSAGEDTGTQHQAGKRANKAHLTTSPHAAEFWV